MPVVLLIKKHSIQEKCSPVNAEERSPMGHESQSVTQLLRSTEQIDLREEVRQLSAEELRADGGGNNGLFESLNAFCTGGSISLKILNIS